MDQLLGSRPTGREIVVAHKDALHEGISIVGLDGIVQEHIPVKDGAISSLDYDPVEDRVIAVGPQLGIVVGDLSTNKWRRKAHTGDKLTCIAFAPDGTRFATGDSDGNVAIWNARDVSQLYRVKVSRSCQWAIIILMIFCCALWVWAWRYRIKSSVWPDH